MRIAAAMAALGAVFVLASPVSAQHSAAPPSGHAPRLTLLLGEYLLTEHGAVALPSGAELLSDELRLDVDRAVPWMAMVGTRRSDGSDHLPDREGMDAWMSPVGYAVAAAAMVGLIRYAGRGGLSSREHERSLLETAIALLIPRPVPIESLGDLIDPTHL